MRERDLGAALAALAAHGSRNGQLAVAAAVRARADRRRRRRHAATGALGVLLLGALGAGIALGQPRDAGHEQPGETAVHPTPAVTTPGTGAPSTSNSTPPSSRPTGTTTRPHPMVLSGSRQIFLYPLYKGEEVPDSLLEVLSGGRVGIGSSFADTALFVPRPTTPGGDAYQILPAKLHSGGEASCVAVTTNGSKPLTLVTAACDAADPKQLFAFEDTGRDNQGRTMFGIRNGDAYLYWNPTGTGGLIAEELGDASLDTTFVVIDRGKASLTQPGN